MKLKLKSLLGYNVFTKSMKKLLIASIILANIPIESFAGTLSQDTRFETFEGNNISIPDILDRDVADVEIQGKSLANIGIKKSPLTSWCSTITIENNVVTGVSTKADDAGFYFEPTPDAIEVMKGKTVTVFLYNVYASDSTHIRMYNRTKTTFYTDRIPINTNRQDLKFVVDIPSDISTADDLEIIIMNPTGLNTWTKIDDKLMILEGDWTDKDTPDYFEGIKSVGQDNKGNHKINIESKSINYIDDVTKYLYPGTGVTFEKIDNHSFRSVADGQSNWIWQQIGLQKGLFSNVKPGDKFTLFIESATLANQYNEDVEFAFRNRTKNTVLSSRLYINKDKPLKNGIVHFTVPDDYNGTDLIEFRMHLSHSTSFANEIIVKNMVLAKGYFDIKEFIGNETDNKEIILNEPLRGLTDTVRDKIVKINNQWFVERNCVEIKLDETNDWRFNNIEGTVTNRYIIDMRPLLPELSKGQTHANTLCDKLPTHSWSQTSEIGISRTDGSIFVYKKSCANIQEFRDWISKNNLNIVMKLETPIYEPLNIKSVLSIYKYSTDISNDSQIPANIKVIVDRILNRVTESVEVFKNNPTMHNLSIARMWINAMEDSVKKDIFQSEVDSVGVADLTMPLKVITSNMDIYIKSENMLSMSLNTNSITFENYSGVDEMEKLNAVNITVNSSLPYDLNAYLPQDISNSDGSKTIDIDVLNIRESGNSTYQRFNGLNNKLVLNDNCAEGNNKVHGIDLKLASDKAHKADVYKTVIKFEIAQK